MKVRARVIVSGRVQGVFFRDTARREAKLRGVTGWIKNRPDGRVEVVLEGEKDSVDALIDFCRRGPPAARVTNVEVFWEEYKGEFKDFKIK